MNVSLTFPLIFLHLFIIRYFAFCDNVYETIALTKDKKRVAEDIQLKTTFYFSINIFKIKLLSK